MRRWVVPLTIVLIISSFFLTFQLKTQAKSNAASQNMSQKNTNLITLIQSLETEIKSQENEIDKVRKELVSLQDQQVKGQLSRQQEELKKAQMAAGLTAVSGPGIILTVDDNSEGLKAKPNDDPNKYIVHYEHILNLVSELKRAGAEAISVNDQRLITTSEIRCVGNVILINTTRIAPPFEIRAIGSPKLLAGMVTNGELDMMKASNYPVALKEENQVIIPAYKGELQFSNTQR